MNSAAKPKLILHIGAPKTGSSAIQDALTRSAPSLRQKGIIVPDTQLGTKGAVEGQQVFEFDEKVSNPQQVVDAIRRLADEPGLTAVVVSAENLLGLGHVYAEALSGLRDRFDISIHAYVRSQDDYIASAWQQWFCKVHSDLWAWLVSELGRIGNWWKMLEPWLHAFGRDAVNVRLYQRDALLDGDAVADFFEAAGLPRDLLATDRQPVVNPSFSRAVQLLAEGNRGLFKSGHDNDFYDAVHALLGASAAKQAGEHLFTTPQRTAILRHYRAPNEALRRTFFADVARPLFKDPPAPAREEATRRPVSSEELRDEVDLLARLFLASYRSQLPRRP
jgi:hypothetical protein